MDLSTKAHFGRVAIDYGLFKLSPLELKRLQATQLEILDDLIRLCDQEKLLVLLQAGSLIGAVLHGGFIPWDDDIDLFMPREDYDRLIEIFPERLGIKYVIQSPVNEPYASFGFIKIRKRNTSFVEIETASFPIHKGICIDIAPLENAPDSKFHRILHGLGCISLRQITISCALYRFPSTPMRELRKKSFKLNLLLTIKEIIGFVFSFRHVGKWNLAANNYCSKYKHTATDYFVSPYSPKWGYFREVYRKDVFLPPVKLNFEGRQMNVPANYHKVLSQKYGRLTADLPPEKRIQHWVVELDFGS